MRGHVDVGVPFLVYPYEVWIRVGRGFRQLRDNARVAREMGDSGRARVEEYYSLGRHLPILAAVIRKTDGCQGA